MPDSTIGEEAFRKALEQVPRPSFHQAHHRTHQLCDYVSDYLQTILYLVMMLATVVERQTADIVLTSTNETVITAIKILIVKPLIAYFYRRS